MASFATDIWESIFTPGPTPPLLLATNVTFGALQLTLASLLLATRSVHCIILSVLCAGLWWSVNWFAAELSLHKAREEEAEGEKKKKAEELEEKRRRKKKSMDSGDDSDTETERVDKNQVKRSGRSADVEVLEPVGTMKRIGVVGIPGAATGGTTSSVSTEDEWEKVSESEREKDK